MLRSELGYLVNVSKSEPFPPYIMEHRCGIRFEGQLSQEHDIRILISMPWDNYTDELSVRIFIVQETDILKREYDEFKDLEIFIRDCAVGSIVVEPIIIGFLDLLYDVPPPVEWSPYTHFCNNGTAYGLGMLMLLLHGYPLDEWVELL